MNHKEIISFVKDGDMLLDIPHNCPSIFSHIMKLCWRFQPSQRPMFSKILEMLLPEISKDFTGVSYYHTDHSRLLRTLMAETPGSKYSKLLNPNNSFHLNALSLPVDATGSEHVRRLGLNNSLCPNMMKVLRASMIKVAGSDRLKSLDLNNSEGWV